MGWVRERRGRAPALTAAAVAGVGTAAYMARRAALRARAVAEKRRLERGEPRAVESVPRRMARRSVRAVALLTLAASVAVPLIRHRYRVPTLVTVAATAAGPFALSVLSPRTKARDAAMYVMQMWAFTIVHELPYDDPAGLRRRLRIDYPIRFDRWLGRGELPNLRLQRLLARPGRVGPLDRFLSVIHWAWFFEPHVVLGWILLHDEDHFPSAARQMAGVYDLGVVLYFAVPTAPPWWASEQGHTGAPVRRLMADVGEETWGRAWPKMYELAGGNPWAAMPSLHFASSVMAAILLEECSPLAGRIAWAYALTLGVALVHLGEHYITDLLAGLAVVAAVRRGEPVAEPVAMRISALAQRLERIAHENQRRD